MAQKLSTARKITLYNTMRYDFKGTDYRSLDTNSQVLKKEITDKEVLQSFNSAINFTESNTIWKGYIIGKVSFDNGQLTWVKISRYGGFFKDIQSNNFYKIEDNKEREAWDNLIENFLAEN